MRAEKAHENLLRGQDEETNTMNDRHTQQAELFFSRARTESILNASLENGREVAELDSPSQQRYQMDMAHGLEYCALAIRDVYTR